MGIHLEIVNFEASASSASGGSERAGQHERGQLYAP
jgi:hypothetical protein